MNFTRCRRYASLDEIKNNRLEADISYKEYKNQELEDQLEEMVDSMYEIDEWTIIKLLKKKLEELAKKHLGANLSMLKKPKTKSALIFL